MPTWTCNNFKGNYPVGVGAVVVASNKQEAIVALEFELKKRHLIQVIKPEQLEQLPKQGLYVRILTDGEY